MFKKSLSLLLVTSASLTATLSAQVNPRRGARAVEVASPVTREQEGLVGPVRRVRTETAPLLMKSGGPVEGPRKLLAVATYDRGGRKVDGEVYLAGAAPAAGHRETYKYDDRGNVVETRVLDASGAMVGQEVYSYEFDKVGNWIVMRTSAAVVESGKLSFEPVEVTYRTITYYLTDDVAKGLRDAGGKGAPPAPTRPETPGGEARAAGKRGAAAAARRGARRAAEAVVPAPTPEAAPADNMSATDPGPGSPGGVGPAPAAAPPVRPKLVKEVTGDALRGAATFLPEPEYPAQAALIGASGGVKVQVVIDERGEVTSALVLSGHPLLADAAERAARRARFSPERLTDGPAEVFGVLTYTFSRPEAPVATVPSPAINAAADPGAEKATEGRAGGKTPAPTGSRETAAPRPAAPSAGLSAAEYFRNGTDLLASGRYKDAVVLLKNASRLEATNDKILLRLGEAYYGAELYEEAAEAFGKAVKISPADAEAFYNLGNSYYAYGRYHQAVRAYQRAVGLKAGVGRYHFGLGVAHLGAREPKAARKQIRILEDLDAALSAKLSDAVKGYEAFGAIYTGNILNRW